MSIPGPHDITRHALPNGAVVLVRENHNSPSVLVSGSLQVGAYDERPEQAGLSAFTADALMHGTAHHTFEEIYETLESTGARVGISGGVHTTGFAAKSLCEDLPLTLGILSDALRYPTFPPTEIKRLRGEILTDFEERAHDTRRMASLIFDELTYPKTHPYARSVDGYPETIIPLDRDHLLDFYTHGYGPRGMLVVIVGGVDTANAIQQVEEILGDWEGTIYEREPLPDIEGITEVRRQTVAIPGKTQSDLVLGYPGPARTDPDYLDAIVCNAILGVFGLMGRLGEKVRDEQGLAYYATSRVDGGPGPGPWHVIAGVNPANVERAIESIREEIRRICEETVDEDELRDNQSYITGSLPLHLETNEGVAQAILTMERYDLGLDYLQRHRALIEEITPERIQAVAQRWLDPDAYAIAIAGPPAEDLA
ncbi:MAG TPA: insulinase family protein [Chloroflexi bacterium]|nr:insulinase family protein [Chloroflexota bacterium]